MVKSGIVISDLKGVTSTLRSNPWLMSVRWRWAVESESNFEILISYNGTVICNTKTYMLKKEFTYNAM